MLEPLNPLLNFVHANGDSSSIETHFIIVVVVSNFVVAITLNYFKIVILNADRYSISSIFYKDTRELSGIIVKHIPSDGDVRQWIGSVPNGAHILVSFRILFTFIYSIYISWLPMSEKHFANNWHKLSYSGFTELQTASLDSWMDILKNQLNPMSTVSMACLEGTAGGKQSLVKLEKCHEQPNRLLFPAAFHSRNFRLLIYCFGLLFF